MQLPLSVNDVTKIPVWGCWQQPGDGFALPDSLVAEFFFSPSERGRDPTRHHILAVELKLIVVSQGSCVKTKDWKMDPESKKIKKVSDHCQRRRQSIVVIPPYLYFSWTHAGVKREWHTCLVEPVFALWPLPSLHAFHSACFWGSREAVTSESTSSAVFNTQLVSTSAHLNQTNSMIKRHT